TSGYSLRVSCSRRQSLTRLRSQSRRFRDWTRAQRVRHDGATQRTKPRAEFECEERSAAPAPGLMNRQALRPREETSKTLRAEGADSPSAEAASLTSRSCGSS